MTTKDRIRLAYAVLADEPGEFIRITDLRDMTDVPEAEMNDALIRMYKDQEVNLIPRHDPMALAEEDRAAAIWCGGEHKHLMSMRAFAL